MHSIIRVPTLYAGIIILKNGLFIIKKIIKDSKILSNGIEIIDSFGNKVIEDKCKAVKIALKVTAIDDDKKVEKIIEIPDNTFTVKTVSAIENWI